MYVEGYGDMWENKDDRVEEGICRRVRGYIGSTKTIKGSRGDI